MECTHSEQTTTCSWCDLDLTRQQLVDMTVTVGFHALPENSILIAHSEMLVASALEQDLQATMAKSDDALKHLLTSAVPYFKHLYAKHPHVNDFGHATVHLHSGMPSRHGLASRRFMLYVRRTPLISITMRLDALTSHYFESMIRSGFPEVQFPPSENRGLTQWKQEDSENFKSLLNKTLESNHSHCTGLARLLVADTIRRCPHTAVTDLGAFDRSGERCNACEQERWV